MLVRVNVHPKIHSRCHWKPEFILKKHPQNNNKTKNNISQKTQNNDVFLLRIFLLLLFFQH